MEITGADKDHITMDNSVSVDLSAGNTVDLMGNLKIIVADDSNFLRFALSAERTGTYEVRGTVFPVTDEWTPLNFGLNIGGGGTSVGFYYDMDTGIGTEDMKAQISTTSDSIPAGNLIYSTSPQEINLTHKITLPPGNYTVEILGKKGLLDVREMKGIPFVGTLPIIGSILFIYWLRTRKVL